MEARSKGKNFLIPAVKASMKKIGGKADGAVISAMVKQLLS